MTAVAVRTTAPAPPVRRVASTTPRLLLAPLVEPRATARGPEETVTRLTLRSVLSPVTEVAWPVDLPEAPQAPELPDPTRLCGSLVVAAVEALTGSRPVAQLIRWVTPELYETLTDRCLEASHAGRRDAETAGPRRTGTRRTTAPSGTGAVGTGAGGPQGRRATVRRTRLFRVSPTAAEATVVIHDGYRVRAAAVRVEVHRGHWRATVLQIG